MNIEATPLALQGHFFDHIWSQMVPSTINQHLLTSMKFYEHLQTSIDQKFCALEPAWLRPSALAEASAKLDLVMVQWYINSWRYQWYPMVGNPNVVQPSKLTLILGFLGTPMKIKPSGGLSIYLSGWRETPASQPRMFLFVGRSSNGCLFGVTAKYEYHSKRWRFDQDS